MAVRFLYPEFEVVRNSDRCIACRACEKRCPFGVPIAERMEKTAKLFGC